MLSRKFLVLSVISTTTLFLLTLPLLSIPIGYPQYASGFLHENLLGLNPPATIVTSPSVSRGIGPSFGSGLGYGSGYGLGYSPRLGGGIGGLGGLGGLGYLAGFGGGLGYGSGLLGLLPSLLGFGSSTFAPGSGMGYGMDYGASSFDQGFDSEFQPSYDPFGSGLEPDSGYDQGLTKFKPGYDPFSSESSFDTPIKDLRSTDAFSTEDSFSSYEGSSDYFSEIPTEDLRDIESFP